MMPLAKKTQTPPQARWSLSPPVEPPSPPVAILVSPKRTMATGTISAVLCALPGGQQFTRLSP